MHGMVDVFDPSHAKPSKKPAEAGLGASNKTRLSGLTGHIVINIGGTGDRDRDSVVANLDLAARDGMVVSQNPDLVLFRRIQRNDRATAHTQKLLHRQDGTAQYDGDLDVNSFDLAHGRTLTI